MYSGLHDQSRWVLPEVLAERAALQPDAPWITTTDGESLTFGGAYHEARCVAAYLNNLGVAAGDRVVVLLPNGLDFIRAWMGLGYLGATAVLLNTELRGSFLHHQITNSGVAVAIVHASLMPALDDLADKLPTLRRVVVVGGNRASGSRGFAAVDWSLWQAATPLAKRMPLPGDIACVMYTSGTTGPAKGVLMPHAHCYLFGLGAQEAAALTEGDAWYIALPLFHANGLLLQLAPTLIAGARAILRERFSASAWLDDIRRFGVTATSTLGVLAAYIAAQPASAADREHGLRVVANSPNTRVHEAMFRERFGVKDVISGFGMTEVNVPIWIPTGRSAPGGAGWVRDNWFDVIIADPATDRPLPAGQVGEILVRPKLPWCFMAGYLGMPERTVEAWRNLWFHTGDAATVDENGMFTFVDRLKDCIRRRGENIAAAEVEAVVSKLPGVGEVAAYAVPCSVEGGEDEVMLAIVRAPGEMPAPAVLARQSDDLLPRFARVRYIALVDELPKTATGKVQRAVLRARGVGDAWDRERSE